MKKATFTFQCRLTAQASFSAYKGSMLRGVLGTFLKKTCCTVRCNTCKDCMLALHCAFPQLFIGKEAGGEERSSMLPPPYCIEPGDTGKTFYNSGERFSFNITLFSYAVAYLPYFVHAITLAGQHGMGKNTDSIYGTFELEQVLHNNQSIFNKEMQKITLATGEELTLPVWNSSPAEKGILLVHLKTPCRFKANNRFSADLSFHRLLNLIVRRIRTLWALDGKNILVKDFSSMQSRAHTIETLQSNLYWKDWTRYSSRQKSPMQLGGLQGSIRYYGDISAFLPFFTLAETLHIGKQTSFGLGQISFKWMPDEKNPDSPLRQNAANHY